MQHDHILKELNFDTTPPGSEEGTASKIFAPTCCICDSILFDMQYVSEKKWIWPFATMLIYNMTMFWKIWHLISPPGSGGVCVQTICYHFAAWIIPLHLTCNMTIFWKSLIMSFWSNPYVRSEITFDMFHVYSTSVYMRNFCKCIDNWDIAKFKFWP